MPCPHCPHCRTALPGPRPIHLITADISLACGHDGHDRATSVPAEVTCPGCKRTVAWLEVAR